MSDRAPSEAFDRTRLLALATELGVQVAERSAADVAVDVAQCALDWLGDGEQAPLLIDRAPPKRREVWQAHAATPRGMTRELAELERDPAGAARAALAGVWGAQLLSTALDDATLGPPQPHVAVADDTLKYVTGFTPEAIVYALGGTFRGSLEPLISNIVDGHVRGVALVLGEPTAAGQAHVELIKELIKRDVLVLLCGNAESECASAGLLTPDTAVEMCGERLAEVCRAVGIGPVLSMGASVSRGLSALCAVVDQGGLGDIAALPIACAAPDWDEAATLAQGCGLAASGALFVLGGPSAQGPEIEALATAAVDLGGGFLQQPDPLTAAKLMLQQIDDKRRELGIDRATERVLMDMSDRRALE
ncbi:MAG: hypothetical protein P9M14_09675 [Candidatus Alcyoniella australis]|nr:hypothetical protein [Candidatus Alcyoniella australis]